MCGVAKKKWGAGGFLSSADRVLSTQKQRSVYPPLTCSKPQPGLGARDRGSQFHGKAMSSSKFECGEFSQRGCCKTTSWWA